MDYDKRDNENGENEIVEWGKGRMRIFKEKENGMILDDKGGWEYRIVIRFFRGRKTEWFRLCKKYRLNNGKNTKALFKNLFTIWRGEKQLIFCLVKQDYHGRFLAGEKA